MHLAQKQEFRYEYDKMWTTVTVLRREHGSGHATERDGLKIKLVIKVPHILFEYVKNV